MGARTGKGLASPHVRWLHEIISPEHIGELAAFRKIMISKAPASSLCLLCKGGRMLCGKARCPIVAKARSLARSSLQITSPRIHGSTPPGIFIGRIGYPKVSIGPMVPPYLGDTEILDTPELWVGKGIQDIIDYRFALIRGKVGASVYDARSCGKLLGSLQELAMSKRPVDAEALLARVPKRVVSFDGETQPFGPSAPLLSFEASEASVDRRIERSFYDKDLKSADAAIDLYNGGVLVTRIQRAFSLGMFGIQKRRKLVPTRWSITAVDSIVSLELIDRIKQHKTIDEYRVYSSENLDNRFVAILMPERWALEWIECWFPGTTWNPERAGAPAFMGDHEPYRGRTTYPDVGGCYYTCRLAVAERLNGERRQASALVLREIHPGYILPVGAWNVREGVRRMLRLEPQKFDTLQAALTHATTKLAIPIKRWVENSELLKRALFQRKLTEFVP